MNPAIIYLAQTDTTVGFVSQNQEKLIHVKSRKGKKGFIISVNSFKTLKEFTRVPQNYKKMIRRSKRSTMVYPNNLAIRVVKDKEHLKFLNKIKWSYSTSSNLSGSTFREDFAREKADVIIYNKLGFNEKNPSSIIKCGKIRKRKLR